MTKQELTDAVIKTFELNKRENGYIVLLLQEVSATLGWILFMQKIISH